MRKISRDTRSVDDIEQGKLVDEWRDLAQERQRLHKSAMINTSTCYVSLTWPMPPEAPRTTAFTMVGKCGVIGL